MRFACALLIGASIAGSSTACTRSRGPAAGEQQPAAAAPTSTAGASPATSDGLATLLSGLATLFAEDTPGVKTGTVAASPIFPEGLSVADECPDSAPPRETLSLPTTQSPAAASRPTATAPHSHERRMTRSTVARRTDGSSASANRTES
jgi:hypothetical protein